MLLYNQLNRNDKSRLWHVTNTTPGTGIASVAGTAFSDTVAALTLLNNTKNDPTVKEIIPSYLKLICTAPGTGSTSLQALIAVDNAPRGLAANAGVVYGLSDSDSITGAADPDVLTAFGALTPTAATAKRSVVCRSAVKTQAAPCLAVGDEYLFIFGQSEQGLGALNGAAANRYVIPVELVKLGAQGLMLLHLWMPANSGAPSFELDLAYYKY